MMADPLVPKIFNIDNTTSLEKLSNGDIIVRHNNTSWVRAIGKIKKDDIRRLRDWLSNYV